MDSSAPDARATNILSLSGGERSYTTLCLLMSLGHVIETPFRVMDEYDVFLDQPSRQRKPLHLPRHLSPTRT